MLFDLTKLSLKVYGGDVADAFKNNSLYFLNLYKDSTEDFRAISNADILPGAFYFFHYTDSSNWMQYSPVFVCEWRKLKGKIIILALNMNFIPLEMRVLIFDKFITDKDFDRDKNNIFLKVDYEGVYNELRKIGFEYALVEYDLSRIKLTHRVSLSLLPRFLYHQHPINKYDPNKLMQIWEAKIDARDERHKEMTIALLSDFYDISDEISEKYNALKGHIQRVKANNKKFGKN